MTNAMRAASPVLCPDFSLAPASPVGAPQCVLVFYHVLLRQPQRANLVLYSSPIFVSVVLTSRFSLGVSLAFTSPSIAFPFFLREQITHTFDSGPCSVGLLSPRLLCRKRGYLATPCHTRGDNRSQQIYQLLPISLRAWCEIQSGCSRKRDRVRLRQRSVLLVRSTQSRCVTVISR